MKPRDTILLPEQRDALDRVRVKRLAPVMVEDLKAIPGVVYLSDEAEVIALYLIKAGWTKT